MRNYDAKAPNAVAACDMHLPNLLRQFAQPLVEGDNVTIPARITRLDKADEAYMCSCGVPAHWYVLRLGHSLTRIVGVIDEELPEGFLDFEQTKQLARRVTSEVLG